jgi:hypothetical protein
MPSRKSFFVTFALIGAIVIAVTIYVRVTRLSLGGTWLLQTKSGSPTLDARMPEAMRIKASSGIFKVSFLPHAAVASDEVETDALQLDGKEHPFVGSSGVFHLETGDGAASYYSAHQENKSIYINERYHFEQAMRGTSDDTQMEKWSLQSGGRQLAVTLPGSEIIYDRAPLGRSLFAYFP